jgi:hypothetical protein
MTHTFVPAGKRVIWRPWTTVNGKRIYARQYGKRAFPIIVDE